MNIFIGIFIVGVLALLYRELNDRTSPTRFGSRLVGRKASPRKTPYNCKIFGKPYSYALSFDESNTIRRATYLSYDKFENKHRSLESQLNGTNPYQSFSIEEMKGRQIDGFDREEIASMHFIRKQAGNAFYEIESKNGKRFFTIEDMKWPESIFMKVGLGKLVIRQDLLSRIRAAIEIGRRAKKNSYE
jgi:hypothetical protein